MSFRFDTGAGTRGASPDAPADLTTSVAVTGLALQANMQAAQIEHAIPHAGEPGQPVTPHLARSVTRSRIKRQPARIERRPRAAGSRVAAVPQAGDEQRDTNSELRDWLKENASLLSNASLLISISAIALKALPAEGVLNPYIQALIFAAALTLLVEMHHQWPDDLQLHMFRRASFPQNHSRRMTTFAVLMQLATVLFAAWAALTNPAILFPLAAFGIFMAFRQWYFPRFTGWPARIVGIIVLILVLVVTEVFMAIVWASFTGGQVTIEFGDRPVT